MSLTLAIIKPDAVAAGHIGSIVGQLEQESFRIRAIRLLELKEAHARDFYAVHRERPFYDSLVRFMTSGPIVAIALERENAVQKLRDVIGATDPAEAAASTIRARYAESKERNAIHASDSDDNAVREVAFFFAATDLHD